MATTLKTRLKEALKKVKNVGRVEEPVVIDNCSLVLQSLTTIEDNAVLDEASELDGRDYLYAIQLGHVSRAVVEIEGVDLRDVTTVEDDVPMGGYGLSGVASNEAKALKAKELLEGIGIDLNILPPDGTDRTILIERHAWVRQQLSTWSPEALGVAYRKLLDIRVEGENRAKSQVQFRVPDETDEDKFRRLLGEAKELEAGLAQDLVKKILDDHSYIAKSTPEELEAIAERTRAFAKDQARLRQEARETPSEEDSEDAPRAPAVDPAVLMQNRQRLNEVPIAAPIPVSAATYVADPPAEVPAQFREAQKIPSRTRDAAALESLYDEELADPRIAPHLRPVDIPELSKKALSTDPRQVAAILDQPPTAGINPKYRPRSQL